MSDRVKSRRSPTSVRGLPLEAIINHDLDVIDDDFLDPFELKRKAIEDAKASVEKFARELT